MIPMRLLPSYENVEYASEGDYGDIPKGGDMATIPADGMTIAATLACSSLRLASTRQARCPPFGAYGPEVRSPDLWNRKLLQFR